MLRVFVRWTLEYPPKMALTLLMLGPFYFSRLCHGWRACTVMVQYHFTVRGDYDHDIESGV